MNVNWVLRGTQAGNYIHYYDTYEKAAITLNTI